MTVTIIVLDSVGLGALPDAASFGDAGSHTLDHTLEETGVTLPELANLGLGNVDTVKSIQPASKPLASFGKLIERSSGKDTTTGHWEFMGVILEHPFQTFPPDYPSFPQEIMNAFDNVTGGHLGNYSASGTVIIEDLGKEHLKTAKPIVYTSADSVFQIATHTDVVPLEKLYSWCEAARALLQGKYAVARVIARPFTGAVGAFERLGADRKDYSVSPPHDTILDALKKASKEVIGIGKIGDIYNHTGLTKEIKTKSNIDGINKTLATMKQSPDGLIFTNLVEFDSLYGHRRNPQGYARALQAFDERLPELLSAMQEDDVHILTSAHGNDPTWHGTDHTREYGMLLAYRPTKIALDLGTRASFADIGATVAKLLKVSWQGAGSSFF